MLVRCFSGGGNERVLNCLLMRAYKNIIEFNSNRTLHFSMRNISPEDLPLAVLETSYTLGQLITATRKSMGLSQSELCVSARIGRSTLNEIEHGSPKVQFAHWLVVLESLGLLDVIQPSKIPGLTLRQIAKSIPLSRSKKPRHS